MGKTQGEVPSVVNELQSSAIHVRKMEGKRLIA
jgi:hypothetical protein